jgi:hypothetical protein
MKPSANTSASQLATELYHSYLIHKEANLILDEGHIAQNILCSRYLKGNKLYDIAQSNKNYVVDLQTLAFTIIDMEFDWGGDLDFLAEVYINAIMKFENLGHLPSVEEMKKLRRLMEKAADNDFDEVEAAKLSIKQGFMHKRPDFDIILSGLFKE